MKITKQDIENTIGEQGSYTQSYFGYDIWTPYAAEKCMFDFSRCLYDKNGYYSDEILFSLIVSMDYKKNNTLRKINTLRTNPYINCLQIIKRVTIDSLQSNKIRFR